MDAGFVLANNMRSVTTAAFVDVYFLKCFQLRVHSHPASI